MYGLGSGSLVGQQQQFGIGQGYGATGINQNLLGPQRPNQIGINNGYNPGYNNGYSTVNMGGTMMLGNTGGQQIGIGALGAPTGNNSSLGGNAMQFRQNSFGR